MLNLPGDLVRRAAANVSSTVNSTVNTVSSTVSSVASVASGRRRASGYENSFGQLEDTVLASAKEKYTLTLKCTPNKDAATTASLSIKSGFMMKRNEQGVWHKKFLCSVPHIFLYYFDSETADSPRGVIDMELYSNISFEDNILKLSSGDEELLRTFYFQDDDKENLNNWSSSLIRDRYYNVCEERNAYQQMQLEMTGVMDSASVQRKSSEVERSALETELAVLSRSHADATAILRSMLVIVGVTEEEMLRLTDVHKIGHSLKTSFLDMKSSLERKYDDALEAMENQNRGYLTTVESLERQIEEDHLAYKQLEALLTEERAEAESRLQENLYEAENSNLNLQMAVAEKTAAETKCTTLSEQKKILVKEVKALRRRLEETDDTVEQLKNLNDRLSVATGLLQKQLHSGKGVDTPLSMHDPVESVSHDNGFVSVDELLLYNDKAVNHIRKSINLGQQQHQVETSDAGPAHGGSSNRFSSMTSKLFSSAESGAGGEDVHRGGEEDPSYDHDLSYSIYGDNRAEGGKGGPSVHDHGGGGDTMSWEMPPTKLKDLGWLNAEQNKLIDSRMTDPTAHQEQVSAATEHSSHSNSAAHRSSSLHMLSGAMTSLMGGNNSSGGADQASVFHETQQQQTTGASRRSSMGMISSMFGNSRTAESSKSHGGALLNEDLHDVSQESGNSRTKSGSDAHGYIGNSSKAFFLSPFGSGGDDADEESPGRMPSSLRQRCLRCEGSVEGPKYSTCRCTLPALCIEDLATGDGASSGGLRMFSGMFSKGSSVAGGIAGGLMRASTAVVYSGTIGSNSSTAASNSGNETALGVKTDAVSAAAPQNQFNDE